MKPQTPTVELLLSPPRDASGGEAALDHAFAAVFGTEPERRFRAGGLWVGVHASASARVAHSPDRRVTLFVAGDVYDAGPDLPRSLLEQYLERGDAFAAGLGGAFAIVVVDEPAECVKVVTDRLNARRVFAGPYGEGYLVSTRFPHGAQSFALDELGVAWYLSHGALHNDRTLFRDIRVLRRACVHTLRAGAAPRAVPYWTYAFEPAERATPERLAAELDEVLRAAVRRCVADRPAVYLALSGGWDAAGVCAVLSAGIGYADVTTFSYCHGPARPGSDESVAAETAARAGYAHRLLESYRGDLADHLRRNAALGGGLCVPCDEADAWDALCSTLPPGCRPAVVTGDQCIGLMRGDAPRSPSDTLASARIWSFATVRWLAPRLPQAFVRAATEGIASDVRAIWARCPQTDNLADARDFLHVDQRLADFQLPCRQAFPGACAAVRTPFLDNAVLDFMRTVPEPLRRGKRLYRQCMQAHYPQVFALPRAASANYVPDWAAELVRNREPLRAFVRSTPSRLDDILPPDTALELLDALAAGHPPPLRVPPAQRIADMARRCLSSRPVRRLAPGLARLAIRGSPRGAVPYAKPADVLRRWLILRQALGVRAFLRGF